MSCHTTKRKERLLYVRYATLSYNPQVRGIPTYAHVARPLTSKGTQALFVVNSVKLHLTACNLFSPNQNNSLQSTMGLRSLFLSNTITVKTKLKENPKTLKTTKEAIEKNKHAIAGGHDSEAQSPWKKPEGWPICSLHKTSRFRVPAKKKTLNDKMSLSSVHYRPINQ